MAILQMLDIARIKLDFQPPECLDVEKVWLFEYLIQRGEKIAPVIVRFDGHQYWLADGFHRVAAAKRLGQREILAEIEPGTFEGMEAEYEQYQGLVREDLRENGVE